MVFRCHVVEFYLGFGLRHAGRFYFFTGCHIVGVLPRSAFVDFQEEKEEEEEDVEREEGCIGPSHHY